MILCDVNVLLAGMVAAAPMHERCRAQLEKLRRSAGPLAVSELVLAAVVRIGTNPRVFRPAPSTRAVFAFADAWRRHPRAVVIHPAQRHWRIFQDLVEQTGIRGSDTTDAYLAALAIEHGCEWWTLDDDFARFPGLRYRNLRES